MGLAGKVVFVSGSTRGIGLAIAREFLTEGASVALTGRSADRLNGAKDELAAAYPTAKIAAIRADMTTEKAIAGAIDQAENELGLTTDFVANVGDGVGPAGYVVSADSWTSALSTNLQSGVLLASAALPRLVTRGTGSFTFISSIAGLEAIGAPTPYAASKAAIQAAAKSYSRQLSGTNVRVNVVAPGNILFPNGEWERKLSTRKESVEELIHREVPLRRFGKPEEIAAAVVFLASERASFVNGATIVVDGGQTHGF